MASPSRERKQMKSTLEDLAQHLSKVWNSPGFPGHALCLSPIEGVGGAVITFGMYHKGRPNCFWMMVCSVCVCLGQLLWIIF